MSVTGVGQTQSTYPTTAIGTTTAAQTSEQTSASQTEIEDTLELSQDKPADSTNQIYSKEQLTKILKDSEEHRMEAFRQMVSKLLSSQGKLSQFKGVDLGSEEGILKLKGLLEDGMQVDSETINAAKAGIADNGEWGVEAVSDRLINFAKAVSGGDKTKIDILRKAIEDGFSAARSAWGGELPEISQKTYEATMKKLDEWVNS